MDVVRKKLFRSPSPARPAPDHEAKQEPLIHTPHNDPRGLLKGASPALDLVDRALLRTQAPNKAGGQERRDKDDPDYFHGTFLAAEQFLPSVESLG